MRATIILNSTNNINKATSISNRLNNGSTDNNNINGVDNVIQNEENNNSVNNSIDNSNINDNNISGVDNVIQNGENLIVKMDIGHPVSKSKFRTLVKVNLGRRTSR
jgi:hypothetical protein